jgi:hypothetical protein
MMLTEEEAKTKWCPLARVSNPAGTAQPANRVMHDGAVLAGLSAFNCIGSVCMAWRWDEPPMGFTPDGFVRIATGRLPDAGSVIPQKLRQGHCGAFGKPE